MGPKFHPTRIRTHELWIMNSAFHAPETLFLTTEQPIIRDLQKPFQVQTALSPTSLCDNEAIRPWQLA